MNSFSIDTIIFGLLVVVGMILIILGFKKKRKAIWIPSLLISLVFIFGLAINLAGTLGTTTGTITAKNKDGEVMFVWNDVIYKRQYNGHEYEKIDENGEIYYLSFSNGHD